LASRLVGMNLHIVQSKKEEKQEMDDALGLD
jgi:hypothetical protein